MIMNQGDVTDATRRSDDFVMHGKSPGIDKREFLEGMVCVGYTVTLSAKWT